MSSVGGQRSQLTEASVDREQAHLILDTLSLNIRWNLDLRELRWDKTRIRDE
jgi:hypothetical protein